MFEIQNYEEILNSAIESNNVEIIEFCKLNVFPCYIDAIDVANVEPIKSIMEVFLDDEEIF